MRTEKSQIMSKLKNCWKKMYISFGMSTVAAIESPTVNRGSCIDLLYISRKVRSILGVRFLDDVTPVTHRIISLMCSG